MHCKISFFLHGFSLTQSLYYSNIHVEIFRLTLSQTVLVLNFAQNFDLKVLQQQVTVVRISARKILDLIWIYLVIIAEYEVFSLVFCIFCSPDGWVWAYCWAGHLWHPYYWSIPMGACSHGTNPLLGIFLIQMRSLLIVLFFLNSF